MPACWAHLGTRPGREIPVNEADARSTAVSVVIADPQPGYRHGIVRFLEHSPGICVVAQVADGHAALEAVRHHLPSVALIALALPGIDAVRLIDAVGRERLATRMLALCLKSPSRLIHDALARGAWGAVSRLQSEPEIRDAIRAAADGQISVAPDVLEALASEVRTRAANDASILSRHERAILDLLAEGKNPREIGQQLHFSPRTISKHIHGLYRRLEARTPFAAGVAAASRGLVETTTRPAPSYWLDRGVVTNPVSATPDAR